MYEMRKWYVIYTMNGGEQKSTTIRSRSEEAIRLALGKRYGDRIVVLIVKPVA